MRGIAMRDQNGRAIGADVERYACFAQRAADAADIVAAQAGVERLAVGLAEIEGAEADGEDHGEAAHGQGGQAGGAEIPDAGPESFRAFSPAHRYWAPCPSRHLPPRRRAKAVVA